MNRTEQSFHVSPSIGMQVYYDAASRTWVGFYFSRETDDQIGDAWHAHRRDEILIFRPEVTAWHHAVATATN